jgi:hypothetical protein
MLKEKEIFYIPREPGGGFYYDPETRDGVLINPLINPIVCRMNEDFTYINLKGAKKYKVPQIVFDSLVNAARQKNKDELDILLITYFTDE